MRKNLTKKLFLSVLTLAFAVISLGASTYAWFVLSEDANVEAFSGTVQSGTSGLEIGVGAVGSTKPVQWRATSLNIEADLPSLFTGFKFDAVQNADPLGTGVFADITGQETVEKDGVTVKTAEGKYLAFELYFRLADTHATTGSESVYLTDYSMDTTGTVENWFVNKDYFAVNHKCADGVEHKDCAKEYEAGDSATYYVSDAARIAIKGAPNSLYLETDTYKGAEGYRSEGKQQYGALSYYNEVSSEDKNLPDTYNNPQYGVTTKYQGKTAICELTQANGYEAKVTVYVWVDGWDGECINAIFGQTLAVDFKFSLNEKAE